MIAPLIAGGVLFLLMLPLGNWAIRTLLTYGIGKHIRVDGPASHQVKAGTATMGGLYILVGITAMSIVMGLWGYTGTLWPWLAMVGYGLLGAFDDLQGLKDTQGVGWLARNKFPWQWGLGAALALGMFLTSDAHPMVIPLANVVVEMGWWFVPVTTVLLVAFSNAVNLTDGLDGLAGGTVAIACAAYGVIAYLAGQMDLSLFAFVMVGALGAFLWFNVHPARLFMGDTGSQALGAGLAAIAVLSGHWLLLPVVGIVFVAVSLSVMLQVGWFKYTRRKYGEGRRLFRMAPLHHHFEQLGWPEVRITLRFWLVAAVAGMIGLILVLG